MNRIINKEKGVTLVALGVTVVVLMIVASITISMLTSDHGIVDEATNAQMQTEVSKLQETVDIYVRSNTIKRRSAKDLKKYTMPEELNGIVTEVNTDEDLYLGIFKSFKEVDFQTKFGKGGKDIKENWTGNMLDLQDCFAIDFATNDIYYIVDGRIWRARGQVSIEEVIEYSKNEGQKPESPKPTTSITPSTKPTESTKPSEEPTDEPTTSPSTEPTTSTEPTVEPTESTEPSTIPSTEPSPKFPTTPLPDPSWQDGPWEFEGFIDKNDEDDDDGITEGEIKDPEIDEPEPDTEYDGVFSKTITLNRYVYKNGGSQNNSIEGKVYKTETKTQAAKVNLGEAEDVTINGGTTAKQREWSKQEEANTKEQTAKNTELELTSDDTYYMSYTYEVKATYYYNNNILTGGEEKTATAYMNHEGNKIGAIPEKPTVTSEDEWKFRGWSENTESNTQDATESLKEITEDTKYYGSYQKAYTATLYEYNNIISTVEGYKYKDYKDEESEDPTVRLDSSEQSTIPDGYVSKYGWATESTSLTKAQEEGATVTLTNQTNNNYYMIYAGETITITLEKDGGEGEVDNPTGEPLCNYDESTKQNASITIPNVTLTKTNYNFLGYADSKGATSAQYLNGHIYISFTESKIIYAVWKIKGTPIDPGKLDPADKNKTLTYENDSGVNEWISFYYDGTYNYIITKDYIDPEDSSQLDPNTGIKAYTKAGSLTKDCYWGDSDPTGIGQSQNNNISDIKKEGFWKRYEFNDTSNRTNSVMAYSILNKEWWTQYISEQAEDAIGSPTLEMYATAYDARYSKGITWECRDSGLYILNYNSNQYGFLKRDDPAFINLDETQCGNCLLSSPASGGNDRMWAIPTNGGLGTTYSAAYANGLRPVVRLKQGVQIVKDSNGNLSLSGRIIKLEF